MILVINSGSATLKFSVFDKNLNEVFAGIVERIGLRDSFLEYDFQKVFFQLGIENHQAAFKIVIEKNKEKGFKIDLVGHRVVHGGEDFLKPTLITKKVLEKLEEFNKLAPLHNPINISCIKASMKLLPKIKNAAVFDTAFHTTMPNYAFTYAIPLEFYKKHNIRRFGFHGISHEYVCHEAAKKLKKPLSKLNLISCHLGSGCSITAVEKGKSIDTSMGFTPLEGLMMSTRSGDLDPAVVFYLHNELKMPIEKINELLNEKSGVLGISGFKDMREVLSAVGYKFKDFKTGKIFTDQEKKNCKLALSMFINRIAKYIGSYFVELKKVDAIIFTGGIGERNADIRNLILKEIKCLGKIKSLVIPANEELMIAKSIVDL